MIENLIGVNTFTVREEAEHVIAASHSGGNCQANLQQATHTDLYHRPALDAPGLAAGVASGSHLVYSLCGRDACQSTSVAGIIGADMALGFLLFLVLACR